MASTTNATQNGNGHGVATVELRDIPISQIVVAEGFNPRGEVVEDADLQAMAATMRERGCLQPIRVRATETGDFALIAGERRYRAATLAALTTLPAVVLTAGAGDEGEYLDLLTDAMIENELRSDLDPLQRARGYQAMIDGGLGVRAVAERLGGKAKRSSREKRIKEHLAILSLPERLRTLVAEQVIPLLAVKTLVELAEIHEEFAHAALRAVTPDGDDSEPYTWQELIENPVDIAMNHMDELPAGVYSSRNSYPVDQFTLSEKAQKDLAAYTKLTDGGQITGVRFGTELVEQARLLGATHEASWFSIILGDDVASRLAEDYIAGVVKEARARQRREREMARSSTADSADVTTSSSAGTPAVDEPESAEERAQREADEAKAERAERQRKREDATKFNLDLGLLVFKHLPKVKVDERVLRILASVDLGGSLSKIAARGARLALPTWVEQVQQKNKTKTIYLETWEAESRAKTFLGDAESAGDIAGRAITLIALAALADEDAVAQSNRSFYTLAFEGLWARQAARDLNAIVRERIKEGQCPALDELLANRVANDERQAEAEAEAEQARLRVQDASARIGELSEEDLEQLLADAELAWGQYSLKRSEVERAVTAERERREAPSGDIEPADERELAEAAA